LAITFNESLGYFSMGKKTATMDVIADEGVRLIQESGGELPNARDLSNATGLSPATVYFHFGSIGGVISYIFRRRISAMHQGIEVLIAEHDPNTHPGVLLDQILDHLFAGLLRLNPALVRKMYPIALEYADRASELDQPHDAVLAKLAVAITRDETGAFKQLTLDEVTLVARGLMAIVRSPLMERNRIFGTAAHIDFAKSYLRKMLLHDG